MSFRSVFLIIAFFKGEIKQKKPAIALCRLVRARSWHRRASGARDNVTPAPGAEEALRESQSPSKGSLTHSLTPFSFTAERFWAVGMGTQNGTACPFAQRTTSPQSIK
jgi:hypothetical protein